MRSRSSRRLAPHRIFWPALAVSAVVAYVVLDAWTWYRVSYPMPASWQPPGELGLTSMPALAWIASVAVAVFLIARWDRGQGNRHDLFALVALGLLVLGQILLAQAALAGLEAGAMTPGLIAVTQARWVLAAAALVGAVALVNIVRSRPRHRGALFAIVALIGAPCTFPILSLVEGEPFEPRIDAELELASSPYASISLFDPSEPPSPVLDVLSNGEFRLARSLADPPQRFGDAQAIQESLERFIAPLPHRDGVPDALLILRIDRAAEFRHVSEAFRMASELRLWKVTALIARTGHDVQGRLMLFLPLDSSDGSMTSSVTTRRLRLARQDGEPRFDWDGEQLDLEAAAERLRSATVPVRLSPDEDVAWEWVAEALVKLGDPSAVQAFATEFHLRIGD